MTPADGIRRLGFRRWYERQLIEAHAWFVTCFLCMIVVAAGLETVEPRAHPTAAIATIALVIGAAAVCLFSLRRYKRLLDRAEAVAEHADCPGCGMSGRLTVLGASTDGGTQATSADGAEAAGWMRVRCRGCGRDWLIP